MISPDSNGVLNYSLERDEWSLPSFSELKCNYVVFKRIIEGECVTEL
ncbi:hypothetical protein APE02nite_19350 [Alkalibacterium pelagium]|jgi:hypothetical protein|uniref:Uncharacterized protein n=1 Tax=Alkalibacterium pelagium TaxID=426702 RepID=A0A1H7MZK5_9LACT|nr:hypothetical protein APE02nite_19350 [Alkalibacterium pelagium]SEL16624.1 hypothetical protein SAMN04488099_11329 [Alkalibacterium pelagium]